MRNVAFQMLLSCELLSTDSAPERCWFLCLGSHRARFDAAVVCDKSNRRRRGVHRLRDEAEVVEEAKSKTKTMADGLGRDVYRRCKVGGRRRYMPRYPRSTKAATGGPPKRYLDIHVLGYLRSSRSIPSGKSG